MDLRHLPQPEPGRATRLTSLVAARCRRLATPRLLAMALAASLAGCAVTAPPINPDARAPIAQARLKAVIAGEEPVVGPISLYEAMARALKYNLDQRIELMTSKMRWQRYELSTYDMLPALVASTGYSQRNNDAASRSRSVLSGKESLEPSVSSDRDNLNADLTASWDVLDFGLAYVRTQQAADEQQIALENRRKVVNRILEDVRTAYWRAVSADRTFKKLAALETLAQRALRQAEELESRRLVAPLAVLSYQRDLLQVRGDAQRMQRELSLAKSQLAALMNLRPDANYPLELPDRTSVIPELPGSADEMVLVGLRFRPELREAAYRQRINQNEINASFLRALPTIKGLLGVNYDANPFLSNNLWLNLSARISWNLMDTLRYPARKRALEAEAAVMDQRDLALTMAVLTQVHVARVRFVRLSQEIATTRNAYAVHERILALSRSGFKARAVSQQSLVREEMNAVLAEVRYDTAYADFQNAFANLYASMGLDNFDIALDADMPIKTMTARLEQYWTDRATSLPEMPEAPQKAPTPAALTTAPTPDGPR